MLAAVPAGGSPAGGTCPVATVDIPGGGEADRTVGSPGVNVSDGWDRRTRWRGGTARTPEAASAKVPRPRLERMSGHPYGHRSDPHREASNSTGRSKCEPLAPKSTPHLERMVGNSGAPSPLGQGEGPRRRRRNWAYAVGGLPGVAEDGMPRRNRQRKHGTARGSPRRSRTAKASRITGSAGKSRRACERGGWGRVSDDGPGHYNPDRSEGPWGRAANAARTAVFDRAEVRDSERGVPAATASTKGGGKPGAAKGMPGAGLTGAIPGKAPSDRPAFQPYWGKPAVRNERGGGGNVGIIRSPVRATTLPDRSDVEVAGVVAGGRGGAVDAEDVA